MSLLKKYLSNINFFYFGTLFLFAATSALQAGEPAEQYDAYLRYDNYVYHPDIHTVQLNPIGDDQAPPIMRLNAGNQLHLNFDDLSAEFKNFSYTFIHCDAYWSPSDLMKQEYLTGFQDNYIEEYTFSLNTLVPYVHYELRFPNEDVSFTKSGNYLLVVFQNDDPNDLILTRRFMVFEDVVGISAVVQRGTKVEYRDNKHEIDFTVNHFGYDIIDPYRDLKIVLLQNWRWDNAISGLIPRFINGTTLEYNYEEENTFYAGNEFRFFDIKDLFNPLQRVARINTLDSIFHVWIVTDHDRSFARYSTYFDINGDRRIRNERAEFNEIESDYAWVHFRLNYPEQLRDGDIYLFGELSDWRFQPEFKMKYDANQYAYTTKVLLKQGYYNYNYVYLQDGTFHGEQRKIEGSHFETENDYAILVYNREMGQRYDRLIGLSQVNSTDIR
jgi:hypothetical protein